MRTQHPAFLFVIVAFAACADTPPAPPTPDPIPPSAAARFRGYAPVQDDLYTRFLEPSSDFELFRYLGDQGEQLSTLVGRPSGFGTKYDDRNNKPNSMNVLVWRMMLSHFASDLAATCPGSPLTPLATPPIVLNANAARIASALCAWPAISDGNLRAAWNLVIDSRAPGDARTRWIALAHTPAFQAMPPDKALPALWLAVFLHPSFLLEQ